MKLFSESVAAKCRYGDVAAEVFDGAEVIWEHSVEDYQGYANVLVQTRDGRFAHYEWTYGSCSGCDEWEAAGHSDKKIAEIMRDTAAWFDDAATLRRYLKLEDEFEEATVPTANAPTNGSIPGMLRYMTGEVVSDFKAMGEAFLQWEQKRSA